MVVANLLKYRRHLRLTFITAADRFRTRSVEFGPPRPNLSAPYCWVLGWRLALANVALGRDPAISRGIRRTSERRIAQWRALNGPNRDVIFLQEHPPGPSAPSHFGVGSWRCRRPCLQENQAGRNLTASAAFPSPSIRGPREMISSTYPYQVVFYAEFSSGSVSFGGGIGAKWNRCRR